MKNSLKKFTDHSLKKHYIYALNSIEFDAFLLTLTLEKNIKWITEKNLKNLL